MLYGGAAGGGKSDALLMAAAQYVHVPGYAALILRKSFPDLMQADGLIPRSKAWWMEKARWSSNEKRWTFPSGATITFGYLERDDDVYQYQGAAFQCICIDELTQQSEARYRYLASRLRRPASGRLAEVPLRMRAGTNPGGAGHEWVRKRFLSDEFLQASKRDPAAYQRHWWHEGRLFVPARRHDNAHLDQAAYADSLAILDPVTRARLDAGDWSAHEGGHFKAHWFGTYRDDTDHWYLETGGAHVAHKRASLVFVAVDPAGGVSELADYTAMVVCALTGETRSLLVLDVIRERIGVENVVGRLQRVCQQWRPAWVVMEDAFAQSAYIRQARNTPGVPTVHAITPGGQSKLVRATAAILKAESGKIYLPTVRQHWQEDFLAELCSFTGDEKEDAHDDQVDALAYAVLAIDRFGFGGVGDDPVAYGKGRGR